MGWWLDKSPFNRAYAGDTIDHRMFNAQIEALIPEYRVLVWDARGHGNPNL